MPVTIKRKQYYTLAEVNAIATSAARSITDVWEQHKLTYINGFTMGWSMNSFMVNKHTGAVTGLIGLNTMSAYTSLNINTPIADIGIHNDHIIKYADYQIYQTVLATATFNQRKSLHNLNVNVSTTGQLTFQGTPTSDGSMAVANTGLYNFYYIGNKYGKIVKWIEGVDPSTPTYLPEGTFYDQNAADLYTGKAWMEYRIIEPTGYDSRSHITFYKNLWSGEVICQYSLYPVDIDIWPAITLPARYTPLQVNGVDNNYYIKPRYTTPTNQVECTAQSMNSQNIQIQQTRWAHGVKPSTGTTWLTGSTMWQGKPETRINNVSIESVVGLWTPDQPGTAIPSANNGAWSATSLLPASHGFVNIGNAWSAVGNTQTGVYDTGNTPSYVTSNSRTGIGTFYYDYLATPAAIATNVDPLQNAYTTNYVPSYKYQSVSGTPLPVYFLSPSYVSTLPATLLETTMQWTLNWRISSGVSAGVVNPAVNGANLFYGSQGQVSGATVNTRMITQGWILTNRA